MDDRSLSHVLEYKIKDISKKIDYNVLILFWQFTIRTLDELDVVANQNLSIEMFLLRLIYLISNKQENFSIHFEFVSSCLEKTTETVEDELNGDPFSCIWTGSETEECYFQ